MYQTTGVSWLPKFPQEQGKQGKCIKSRGEGVVAKIDPPLTFLFVFFSPGDAKMREREMYFLGGCTPPRKIYFLALGDKESPKEGEDLRSSRHPDSGSRSKRPKDGE